MTDDQIDILIAEMRQKTSAHDRRQLLEWRIRMLDKDQRDGVERRMRERWILSK